MYLRFCWQSLLLFLIGMLVLNNPLYATEKLTLDKAIEIALQKNLDIQVARGNNEIQRNNTHIGNANFLPSINLNSAISYQEQQSQFGGTVGQQSGSSNGSTITTAQIEAGLTIFDGLNNIYSFYKLKQQAETSDYETRQRIEDIVLQVSQGYFAVANTTEQLKIAREALFISKERLSRAEKKAEFGQDSKLDVLSATVDMNKDSVTYLNAGLALDNAKRSLNVLLSRDESTEFEVVTDVEFKTPHVLDTLTNQAKTNNAAYLIQQSQIEQAESGVSIATSTFLPKLTASVGYGFTQFEEGFNPRLNDPSKGLSAGLNLSLNLFNGFRDNISRQNAHITLKNQQRLKEKVWRELKQELADTYQTYKNSLRIKDFEEKNLETADLNFKRSKEQYNIGRVTITTFREAQLNLIEAKSRRAKAGYDAKINELKLLKLAGRLVE